VTKIEILGDGHLPHRAQFLRDNRNPGIERFFGSMEVTLTAFADKCYRNRLESSRYPDE
jgi:hypothetical protein